MKKTKQRRNIIMYSSMSGNTQEVAELIRDHLEENGELTFLIRLQHDGQFIHEDFVAMNKFYTDGIVAGEETRCWLGTYTWGQGEVPDEWEKACSTYNDFLVKWETRVFGTGDTQFGGDKLFCSATEVITDILVSGSVSVLGSPLKIEQSPRGSQEQKVKDWVDQDWEELWEEELRKIQED